MNITCPADFGGNLVVCFSCELRVFSPVAHIYMRLQATFKKVIKQGLIPANHRSYLRDLRSAIQRIGCCLLVSLGNACHSLHHLLPPKRQTKYVLRKRAHNREIPLTENSVMKKTFIIKMYLNTY